MFQGKTQDEAGEIEEEQGMKLARAAAATASLEHYIWSTTPSSKRKSKGKILTPHTDYKANVDGRIKSELPELAAMTTYLYFGYYPQNMAFFPLIKPIEYVSSAPFIQCTCARGSTDHRLTSPVTASSSRHCLPNRMQRYSCQAT